MSVETHSVTRTTEVGSRTVAWTTYGAPAGRPVVYFHGAGGSRLEGRLLDADAAAAGLRVISVDRPGSGQTSPMPSRTLLRSVGDLAAVLDTEEVDRFAVAGLSAGAMYAWATGEAYRDRVSQIVAISPAMNIEPYADVRAALSTQFKLMTFLARRMPGVLAAMQRRQQSGFEAPNGQAKFVKQMRKISPDDATLLEDLPTFTEFRAVSAEGRRQGFLGGEEFALVARPWGFDPAAQTIPCTVVYGSTDPLTPAIRAWLSHAPHAVGKEVPGGHLQTSMAIGRAAVIETLTSGAA
jgi:pimeloyl-ACP methyl ester carboxylesterase